MTRYDDDDEAECVDMSCSILVLSRFIDMGADGPLASSAAAQMTTRSDGGCRAAGLCSHLEKPSTGSHGRQKELPHPEPRLTLCGARDAGNPKLTTLASKALFSLSPLRPSLLRAQFRDGRGAGHHVGGELRRVGRRKGSAPPRSPALPGRPRSTFILPSANRALQTPLEMKPNCHSQGTIREQRHGLPPGPSGRQGVKVNARRSCESKQQLTQMRHPKDASPYT